MHPFPVSIKCSLCVWWAKLSHRLRLHVGKRSYSKSLKMRKVLSFLLPFTWKRELVFHNTFCSRDASNLNTCGLNRTRSHKMSPKKKTGNEFVWNDERLKSITTLPRAWASFPPQFSESMPTFLVDHLIKSVFRIYTTFCLHFVHCVFKSFHFG